MTIAYYESLQLSYESITVNEDKCEFEVTISKFIGHIIDYERIRSDPEKTRAIRDFPVLSNRKELRRFFEIVNSRDIHTIVGKQDSSPLPAAGKGV